MSSLSDLVLIIKETQSINPCRGLEKATCLGEQLVHDMDKTLDRLTGETMNVNRHFDTSSATQGKDIDVLKAKVKVPDPPKFKGMSQQLTFWIESVENWLEAGRVPEAEKVMYAQGHLEGEASRYWFSTVPLIGKDGRNPHDYAEFKKALSSVYGHADQEHKAREALDALRQGPITAEAYVQRFMDLLSPINAQADECMTTQEKIHKRLRAGLEGKSAINHTTGERFKDFLLESFLMFTSTLMTRTRVRRWPALLSTLEAPTRHRQASAAQRGPA